MAAKINRERQRPLALPKGTDLSRVSAAEADPAQPKTEATEVPQPYDAIGEEAHEFVADHRLSLPMTSPGSYVTALQPVVLLSVSKGTHEDCVGVAEPGETCTWSLGEPVMAPRLM